MFRDSRGLAHGQRLFFQGKMREALDYYLPYAHEGDVTCQMFVGWVYAKGGNGVAKDLFKAEEWLSKASRAGDINALYILATVHFQSGNRNKGIAEFCKAHDLGYSAASYQLGKIYLNGFGVKPDKEKAFKYFVEASKRGHIFARKEVALMLIRGKRGIICVPFGFILLPVSIIMGIWSTLRNPYSEHTFD